MIKARSAKLLALNKGNLCAKLRALYSSAIAARATTDYADIINQSVLPSLSVL